MPERAKGVRVSLGKQKEVGEPRGKNVVWENRMISNAQVRGVCILQAWMTEQVKAWMSGRPGIR